MKEKKLLILGEGTLSKVYAEAAELQKKWVEIAFLDDEYEEGKDESILGKTDAYPNLVNDYPYAIVAIENKKSRALLLEKVIAAGYKTPAIIHPKAIVSKSAEIGKGTIVLAGAVVNTNVKIGKGCIVNIGTLIDYGANIGNYVNTELGKVYLKNSKAID